MATKYRLDFTLQRRREGDDDFEDIGYGSSGAMGSPADAAYEVESIIQNWIWETGNGMPDPEEVAAELRGEVPADEH